MGILEQTTNQTCRDLSKHVCDTCRYQDWVLSSATWMASSGHAFFCVELKCLLHNQFHLVCVSAIHSVLCHCGTDDDNDDA
jgi:hypothetical protein